VRPPEDRLVSNPHPGPSPAGQGAPSSPTRKRILDAAEALFAERGLRGTAVRDIADAVGLTPGSLYNHFEGKRDLYEAVISRGVWPLMQMLEELPAREEVGSDVDAQIRAIMEHLAARPHLPRLIYQEAMNDRDSMVELAQRWVRPLVDDAIAWVKEGEPTPWAEEELPLVLTAWIHLVFGYFAMAPMTEGVLGRDPFSDDALALQTRVLEKLARLLQGG
jgi:AcrR family transcriptional regulator